MLTWLWRVWLWYRCMEGGVFPFELVWGLGCLISVGLGLSLKLDMYLYIDLDGQTGGGLGLG